MKRRPIKALLFLTLPSVVVAIGAAVMMHIRVPTRVQVDLTVNRAAFQVGGSDWTQILNAVEFESVTVEMFSSVRFTPEYLEQADPEEYLYEEDRFPESAWTPLRPTPPVVISAQDQMLRPAVTLDSGIPKSRSPGMLDRVWAGPEARVILELTGADGPQLMVSVDGQESSVVLSIQQPFQMSVDYGYVSGIRELPYQADSLTFRGELPPHSPTIEVMSQPESIAMVVEVPPGKAADFFPPTAVPATALEFTRQAPQGFIETTLVKEGEILYLGYPDLEKARFDSSDFVGLRGLGEFYIQEMGLDLEHEGLHLVLSGVASHVKTGTSEFSIDHRLTLLDILSHNRKLVALVGIILWVFPTTVGAYRLYKELGS